MKNTYFIFDPLHFIFSFNDCLCRHQKFVTDLIVARQVLDSFLVAELMLQGCPKVHTICADLNFHTHRCFSFGEKYRYLHDHMITPISIIFRIFDVILDFYYFNIILLSNKVCNRVNIIDKCTDYTHAGNIVQLFLYVLGVKIISSFCSLL